MEADNDLIVSIWELVKGYCPAKKRDELAHRILHVFEDHGMDSDKYECLLGEDFNLDNAVNEWIEEHAKDEEREYEFNEYFVEDEE
ncbi:MAG: hypothetical protein HC836_40920 [Richelia sp. RM2_1_2]|nr:hypothetical protein [Richelia sp. RM2_1_2]